MKRKNSMRNALFTSIISMLLCVSMLVGTTFAWFTDSVVSANNIIKSGNLDIVLEYWDGVSWKDVQGQSDILSEDLWEPGYVDVAYLRLKNAGSLALKYQLGVNIVTEKPGVNQAGAEFKLSDYIYFDVIEGVNGKTNPYPNRAAALAVANQKTKISAGYSKAGALEAGSEDLYLALVVHMPTTVGNVANHNGKDVPQIDLGINVFATQFTSEEDSFDKLYDGGANWLGGATIGWYLEDPDATEFVISSAEELAGLAAIVNGTATSETATYAATQPTVIKDDFAGQTIKLASNIDLAGKAWTPIGSFEYDQDAQTYANVVSFKGTFDGQGHTISNLKINTPNTDGAALFGCVEAATIKNVNVRNVNIVAKSHAAPILARGYNYSKTTTVTNCHVTGNVNILIDWAYAGGIVAKATGLKISDCSVLPTGTGSITASNRNAVGGIVGWVEAVGATTVENCVAKDLNLTGWANIGSINGYIQAGCTITGCSAENIVLTKTRVEGHPTIGLVAGGFSYNATQPVTLTNNTVKNITLNGTHVAAPASANVLYGAEFSGNANSNFVLDNNTTENITNNLVEVVKATTTAALKDSAAVEGATVVVPAGEFTMPSTVAKDVTLLCDEGTVFTGKSGLNINGATVIGATFENTSGSAVAGTINGNFKDCTFESSEALRWCYSSAGTTSVFENCVIKTDFRGVHFDDMAGNVIFKNCEINGFNAIGGEGTLTFEGCTFGTDTSSGYNGLNLYCNTVLKDCKFIFASGKTNFIDMEGTGKTLTITNCTATKDGTAVNVADYVGGSKLADNTVVYN